MHPVGFPDPFDRTRSPLQIVAVIPARYDATRLPGKALADIGGRPMVEHVYRRAAAARGVDAVVVATDDERIVAAVQAFGGVARMTRPTHRTGTDRIAEVAAALTCDVVVNVQGDEPLLEPEVIEQLVGPLVADASVDMSTVCRPITDVADYGNPNVVKVVTDTRGRALYFSRSPIPYMRDLRQASPAAAYKHIGLYGYRRGFLLTLAGLPQTPLEIAESLEQLRALEHGYDIHVVTTEHDSIGVDTPEDLARVRQGLGASARP